MTKFLIIYKPVNVFIFCVIYLQFSSEVYEIKIITHLYLLYRQKLFNKLENPSQYNNIIIILY